MSEEEARKRQIEAARATREYAPVMAQEVSMSGHTPCIVCGLADHQDQSLPIEALRHALAWHIIYEGVTPKLRAALEECLEQLAHEGLDRTPAAIHAREAIKEATLDAQKAANDETDS
jgi:hypothetical protein